VTRRERFWRWCRRNPAVASLLALLMVVFLVGFAGVTVKWREAEHARQAEHDSREEADQSRQAEHDAREEADKAKKLADERAEQIKRELERVNEANHLLATAQNHMSALEFVKAESALNEAVRLRPDYPSVWTERAELYNRLCLWDLAAPDYARVLDLQGAANSDAWHRYAILMLLHGHQDEYRRQCLRMYETYRASPDTEARSRVALACLLAPEPVIDPAKLLALAEPTGTTLPLPSNKMALGIAHYRSGQYDKALSEYQAVGTTSGWDTMRVWKHAALALTFHRLGQAEQARTNLTEARRALEAAFQSVLKTNKENLAIALHPLVILLDRIHLPAALLTYREAVTLIEGSPPPEDPRLWLLRGRGLGLLGRVEAAEKEFARALAARPNDADFRLAYFRSLADQGRWDRADEELARAAALHPNDTDPWLEGFRVFTEHQQWERADRAMARVGKLAPRNVQIRVQAWRAYVDKEQWERAAAQLAKAVEIAPENAVLRLALFGYHADKGQWDKADAEYARVIAERPKNAQLHLRAGLQYLNGQHHEQAAAAFARAAELDPENPNPWNQLGVCYYRLRMFDKAIEPFTRSINLQRTNGVYWANRASCYAELQRWKEAAADCAEAVRLAPQNLDFRRDYAFTCLASGQEEKYRQVCAELFKSFEDSPNNLAVDPIVRMCVVGRDSLPDLGKLPPWIERWASANEKHVNTQRIWGYACCRAGDHGKAVVQIKRAIELQGKEDLFDGFMLALADHHLGDREAARAAFTRGLEARHQDERGGAILQSGKRAPPSWQDRLGRELLGREVEAILNVPHRREAEAHLADQEWAKAIPHLDKLIDAAGANFWPDLTARGNCYAELGDLKKAHADYALAVKLARAALPHSAWVYWNHNLLCLELGDQQGYLDTCARLTERYGSSDNLTILWNLARICRHPGKDIDRARAVRWMEKVMAVNSNLYNQAELAIALFRAGQYEPALKRYQQMASAREADKPNVFDYFLLALMHHHLGHAGEARRHLAQGVEWMERYLHPGFMPPEWWNVPDWTVRLELAALRREAEALIGVTPPSAIGRCMGQKKWAEAVALLDRRLAAGDDKMDLTSRARCHVELRQWVKAAADYAKLVELEPDNPWLQGDLALAQLAADNREGYRRTCEAMLERFGGSRPRWMASTAAYRSIVTPDAVADPARLVAVAEIAAPDWEGNVRILGAALYRAGRVAEALPRFEEAVRVLIPDAWDWLFLAMAHHRLGHGKEARECLDRAARWIEEADRRTIGHPRKLYFGWYERVELKYLRREAEALLGSDAEPPPVKAPAPPVPAPTPSAGGPG
jgi:tetratricopeptide (TPR) repeat protein